MKEREMFADILEKMCKEDLEEKKRKLEKKKYLQQIMDYEEARKKLRRVDEEKQGKEESSHVSFRLAQKFRQEEAEKRLLRPKSYEKVQGMLVDQLEEVMEEKERNEYLRMQLAVKEKELNEKGEEKWREGYRQHLKEEPRDVYSKQIWLNHKRKEQERKDDELFQKKMIDTLYEQDKLELLSNQKRCKKQKEHRQIIQKMMEERRARILEEKERVTAEARHLREIEIEKQKLLAEEKRRILLENAPDLLGYLPKHIIQNEEEITLLGEKFQEFYKQKGSNDEEHSD